MTAALQTDDRRPLSVPQLAARWGCSEGLVRKLIRNGDLHCFRPGALIRISAAEVERFECQQMTAHTASSASEAGSRSSIISKESASDANLTQRIARAPRRRPAVSGPVQNVARGPWAGA